MNPEEYIELFEKYRLGLLDGNSEKLMREKLEKSPEITGQYEAYCTACDAIELRAIDNIKSIIRKSTSASTPPSTFSRLRIAVAIALLLGLSFTMYKANQHSTENLIQAHLMLPKLGIERSNQLDAMQDYSTLLKLVAEQNFEGAYEAIRQKQGKPQDAFYLQLQGQVMLQVGKFEEAVHSFGALVEKQDPRFSSEAHWHLALAYLGNEQREEATKLLKDIIQDPNSEYGLEAKELLSQLQSPWGFFDSIY